jgi:RNA-directed DNA polymerase
LERPYKWVIKDIQSAFESFTPQKIRRKYIDKPGKAEKRPLGIPSIRDRIVQECIRIVLEPILEAQFFNHSYGFRPMRDTQMALQRITDMVNKTGYYWVIEGDISKCFDKINHGILLKRLYHMGIKDRRLLQIIKVMFKAGIIGECEINDNGVQQGGNNLSGGKSWNSWYHSLLSSVTWMRRYVRYLLCLIQSQFTIKYLKFVMQL